MTEEEGKEDEWAFSTDRQPRGRPSQRKGLQGRLGLDD